MDCSGFVMKSSSYPDNAPYRVRRVVDGDSFRELWTLYETFSNGKPSPFERLPVQYSDYAVWQRKWLQGEVLESQLSYWKHLLDSSPPMLNLPTDRPRPARQILCASMPVALSESLTEAINELSRREGVTQYMTLLAAFNVLLYRYSNQEDILVGSPIAHRHHPEVESLIGYFVNTFVLRIDLSGKPTFRSYSTAFAMYVLAPTRTKNSRSKSLSANCNPNGI